MIPASALEAGPHSFPSTYGEPIHFFGWLIKCDVIAWCGGYGDCEGDVRKEHSRTAYHYEGLPGAAEDPNKPAYLCRRHAVDHHEHWDEMWASYYSDRL